ncbi:MULTISPECIES: fluoride efflux transporter FluC [Halomonas]|uniref:Fluoride-specific ion channel FluC n=2 Tax=Halomonas TaxID=2745 RepID=A0A7X5AM33_9GAMM|nr:MULTISPECIES: CrcB family protein [Halomonas]MDR5902488.1 CrcB family protein [Halomonas icarae]NAW13381.1 chromosome condensation protein CrcB [Halomonas icarae]TDB03248.1 CrcB family protein [Halomonas marinisediminis]
MSNWRAYAAVGLGSGLGSLARFQIGVWMAAPGFPWATLVVNLAGSGLITLLAAYAAGRPHGRVSRCQPLLIAGFCGGFTTFSLFGLETLAMLSQGHLAMALVYVALSLAGWLSAAWVGHLGGRRLATLLE